MARVLVVDDASYFRMKIKQMLEAYGHEVVGEATNGQKSAVLYAQVKPDLVTMDISMPESNGIDGVKAIIEKDPEAKIIMVSAMGQKTHVLEAMRCGAKHFVLKPFQKEVLDKVIQQVLNEK
jgi:two-component system chemotaxis response regulator CheY